jgi:hypothetical protein
VLVRHKSGILPILAEVEEDIFTGEYFVLLEILSLGLACPNTPITPSRGYGSIYGYFARLKPAQTPPSPLKGVRVVSMTILLD